MTRPVAIPTWAASGAPYAVNRRHGRDQLKARVDRTLGIALMGPGPAEADEHAAARVFGDVPVPAL